MIGAKRPLACGPAIAMLSDMGDASQVAELDAMTNGKTEGEINALLSEASAEAIRDADVTWEIHRETGGSWDAEYTASRALSGDEKAVLLTIKTDHKRQFHLLTD
jgi:hypothetical protein